jgi:hypothetical protein
MSETKHDKLDPRTQTENKSEDAKKSMANAGKVPPSLIDSKAAVEDHAPGETTIDKDVEKSHASVERRNR